jgi:polysaccharide pyruvyl transferase WcaK-like protein
MTFWWSNDNYGQILQCYALQKYLRNMGHDAYLIKYNPANDFVKTPLWIKFVKAINLARLVKYLSYMLKKKLIYTKIENANKQRDFDGFRRKYIKQYEKEYFSYDELVSDPPEADIYIAGSDQIWNPNLLSYKNTKNQTKAYFLDFVVPGKKRIAHAASFGKETLPDEFIQEITPLLHKFDYISVREKSGLDLCQQCGIDTAEWVPDPVVLLNVNDYRALYSGEPMPKPEHP